jgi:hypothetical protein
MTPFKQTVYKISDVMLKKFDPNLRVRVIKPI